MKIIIFNIYKFILVIYFFIFEKVSKSNNRLSFNGHFLGKLKISGGNNIIKLNGTIKNSEINVIGNNNFINISKGDISNLQIRIIGDNHRINIENHRGIINTKLLIFDYANTIDIGEFTGIGGARLVVCGYHRAIKIGKYNMISDCVEMWASDSHSILDNETRIRVNEDKNIELRDHVWVGIGVCILKGVTIHSNSIIGMGSIVVNDVPANSLSIGNPNRTIKENIDWCIERI
jgi:acetyltransferase-like isoleucine patch superfamily enzyme